VRGGVTRYAVTGGRVHVTARSSIHDTRTIWSKLEGTVEVDPADPGAGAAANVRVDMRAYDAGDRLKNWKLRSDLQPDEHPTATFRLERLDEVRAAGEGRFEAIAVGILSWRGREVPVRAPGSGRLGPEAIEAEATFELDVTGLGVQPPKILMFKVEPVVSVQVRLEARAA
jgi:polyisoprenoid-binding protein YceI